MKIKTALLATMALLALGAHPAYADPTPLSVQIDRTLDPSPLCANRLASATGCQTIGKMSSGGQFTLPSDVSIPNLPFNAKAYGAVADGSSHALSARFASLAAAQAVYPFVTSLSQQQDWAALQSAVNAAIAASAPGTQPVVTIPAGTGCYIVTDQINANISPANKAVSIRGDGACITVSGLASSLLNMNGGSSAQKFYLEISGVTLTGDRTASGVGVNLTNLVYLRLDKVVIQNFAKGLNTTDVDQTLLLSSNIIQNVEGAVFNTAVTSTGPNSITLINTAVSLNDERGITASDGTLFIMIGGSVQYNGVPGGGSTQYGVRLNNYGYSGAHFDTVDFEGNGGQASIVVNNTTIGGNVTVSNSLFLRTAGFPSFGSRYGTYQISAIGTQATNITLSGGNAFVYNGTYAPDAARPNFDLTNTLAKVFDDGSTIYQSTLEAPSWAGAANMPKGVASPFVVGRTTGTAIGGFSFDLGGPALIRYNGTDAGANLTVTPDATGGNGVTLEAGFFTGGQGPLKLKAGANTAQLTAAGKWDAPGYSIGGTAGASATVSVRKGDDSGACNLVFTSGLYTSTTC